LRKSPRDSSLKKLENKKKANKTFPKEIEVDTRNVKKKPRKGS